MHITMPTQPPVYITCRHLKYDSYCHACMGLISWILRYQIEIDTHW